MMLRDGSHPGATARERIYSFLAARPAGARADELLALLFRGTGSDPELGPRILARLLGDDPHFCFEAATGFWSLSRNGSLKVPLEAANFVVVDLETVGGRPGPGTIVEIGACRMTGQRIVDRFQSLVRPRTPIPPFISRLTSISNEMVADAPPIERVMPAFRDFLGEAVMVAHNAPFDFAFLDFEFRRLFGLGLMNPVLCTLKLSRRMLPSLKRRRLDALAEHFGLSTEGRHRGLGDARMAAELFAIFLEMAVRMGVTRLDRLLDLHGRTPAGRRLERHVPPEVIAAIPQAPGVYLMRNERGELLYVGKARRLRDRVGSYFNGGMGTKAKVADLVSHVHAIETRPARSTLEAALTEAELIRELKPPYNRMLKNGPSAFFLKIDLADRFPKLAATTKMTVRRGVMQLGPFVGRGNLDRSIRVLARLLGLRTCGGKLAPDPEFAPCIYGQMGRCAMPCNATVDEADYEARVRRALEFLRGRSGPLLGELAGARDRAAAGMRFEEARRHHRDLEALATLAARVTRLSQVVTENNLLIVTGEGDDRALRVVLSGRLALTRRLDSPDIAIEIARFVADHYERFRARPIARDEIEAMTIVARWLREREPADGRLIYLNGPSISPDALRAILTNTGNASSFRAQSERRGIPAAAGASSQPQGDARDSSPRSE
ncbi:MAG TPA: exonuclease domain-containing protein [Candidatus Binataceae bacterium]|nr:exonuclease domain-containing protein [Candidatus Binataceae bacterium]